jgi:SAM-dependent methyltransferase
MNQKQIYLSDQYKDPSYLDARIRFHEQFSANKTEVMTWFYEYLHLPSACKILELGCGTGKLWHLNIQRIPSGWSIIVSDFSKGMIERVQQVLSEVQNIFSFQVLNAQHIPFKDNVFDAVIANNMLHHVSDVEESIRQIQRILRPGGRLFTITNGRNHMRELDDLVPSYIPHIPPRELLGNFLLQDGQDILGRHFEVVNLHKYNDYVTVTEADPLVLYCLSRVPLFDNRNAITRIQKVEFKKHVEKILRDKGGRINIAKDTGLLIATKKLN